MERALLFLYAESPVHAGGDSALGAVDLPIQREAGTGLPVIWGQSLKGALRDHFSRLWRDRGDLLEKVFGSAPPRRPAPGGTAGRTGEATPEPGSADRDAEAGGGVEGETASMESEARAGRQDAALRPGSLSVGDAQLLAMPVPTLRKTFAWTTSPLALDRLARKIRIADVGTALEVAAPTQPPDVDPGGYLASSGSGWAGEVALGPYLVQEVGGDLGGWAAFLAAAVFPPADDTFGYFRRKIKEDLLSVSDDVFPELTVECAEVSARVQLSPVKTVASGPFYVEYLPTETVLVALLECRRSDHLAELAMLNGTVLRLGGDETIGKGLLWCHLVRRAGG